MEMQDRIKQRRIELGYTQEELANRLGLQKSAIAKYENGRVENIKRTTILKMAEVLQCSPSYLMGWEDVKPKSDMQKLSPREYTHLSTYRSLSDPGKERVDSYTEKVKSLEADESDQNVVETFQKRLVARNGNKNLSPSDMKKILEILDNQ